MLVKLVALVVASLALTAPSASAAVSVGAEGDTLAVLGSDVSDRPTFSYLDPDPGGPGYTRIFDDAGVADPDPPCFRPANDPFGGDNADVALCEDGGTATRLVTLVLDLGGGDDSLEIAPCFNTIVADLGEGANRSFPPDCAGGTFDVLSGSGRDSVMSPPRSQTAVTADLGAGDDHFIGGDVDDAVAAGSGNDILRGQSGNDTLNGAGDNDKLAGGPGDDTLDGGDGDDELERENAGGNDAGIGRDTYVGGAGTDRLLLDGHDRAVTISINGAPDDGSPGEGDNVGSDIEEFDGTEGNDVFNGSGGSEVFHGRAGDDTLRGGGGNDTLEGSVGLDTVDGGPGADRIYGDGITCFFCNGDPDRLFARDGEQDIVNCGNGGDTAQVDHLDVVGSCAVVEREDPPREGDPPRGGGPPRPVPTFATSGRLSRAKGIGFRVTCPAACSFNAKLTIAAKVARKVKLGRKAVTIGTAKGNLAAAGEKTLKLKLSAKARKRLRKLKSVPATLTVAIKDAAGTTSSEQAIKLVR